jgi:hypothetical protein
MNSVLTTIIAQSSNEQIYCKLRQKIVPGLNSPQIGDLNQNFYLLLAMGNTTAQGKTLIILAIFLTENAWQRFQV